MPMYEYECQKCGERFDGFASIANRDESKTCQCGGSATREEIPIQGSRVDTGGGYQMAAVTKKGEKIQGHFGQYAPIKKQGKWR